MELYKFGVSTQDIADLLGKTRNSIDIQLTALRKEGKISSDSKKHGDEETINEEEKR